MRPPRRLKRTIKRGAETIGASIRSKKEVFAEIRKLLDHAEKNQGDPDETAILFAATSKDPTLPLPLVIPPSVEHFAKLIHALCVISSEHFGVSTCFNMIGEVAEGQETPHLYAFSERSELKGLFQQMQVAELIAKSLENSDLTPKETQELQSLFQQIRDVFTEAISRQFSEAIEREKNKATTLKGLQ